MVKRVARIFYVSFARRRNKFDIFSFSTTNYFRSNVFHLSVSFLRYFSKVYIGSTLIHLVFISSFALAVYSALHSQKRSGRFVLYSSHTLFSLTNQTFLFVWTEFGRAQRHKNCRVMQVVLERFVNVF